MTHRDLSAAERKERKERRWALEGEAIKFACPDCGAIPGSPCESLRNGEIAAQMHKRRIRLSTYKPAR
jgi:predicted RNA-binding Zn-ribbon protein involved in translation (DUF1610 family)